MSITDPLYSDYLLDLNRHPHNKQALVEFDVKRHEKNPLCSDDINLFMKFDAAGKVSAVGYTGDGCAVSQAGSSLLTDFIKGKAKTELAAITKEQVLELMGLPNITPARIGCATLALKALQKSLI